MDCGVLLPSHRSDPQPAHSALLFLSDFHFMKATKLIALACLAGLGGILGWLWYSLTHTGF